MQLTRLSARGRSNKGLPILQSGCRSAEEYPFPKPESCSAYSNGTWTPADLRRHYCRLTEVIDKESFL